MQVVILPVKYFNARLQHYSGRFATNLEYNFFFFAQFRIEQKKVSVSKGEFLFTISASLA